MKFTLDTTFRFHLRCALYIALAAAAATLVGAFAVSQERLHGMAETQRGLSTDTARLQRQLDREVGEMRTARDEDIAAFQSAMKNVSERQAATDERSRTAASRSPFPIEKIIGSIVELVCIDNKDRDTYYTGSGTIIDKSGLIITNQHILVSGDNSLIRYCGVGFTNDLHDPPKIEYVAAAVAVHDGTDLALLRISEHLEGKEVPKEFPAISLADAKAASLGLNLGDPIYIGGYPGIGAETFTFTSGVVSGRVGTELIKTSALIDSGTSGGAAFDGNGRYVGVPTAAAKGEIGGSLGYLIGANVIDEFLADYANGKNALKPVKR
ncbi:MAG TPA: serine protease [Candidatus Binatia bacterium]|jgi:S1-C subfamily serine protease|nr:serine protease [Candidatus Binatia bacterium]